MSAIGSSIQINMQSTIFIHSSFRVSSTWFWALFRSNPHLTTYYEIFNPCLAFLTHKEMTSNSYDRWNSKHPPIASYFLEFSPLIDPSAGGVNGYEESMAYGCFIPKTVGQLSQPEIKYIKLLIENAKHHHKRTLISATRSLGRIEGIKKEFNGYHILLHRNIFYQWGSYTEQWLSGNSYFIDTIWKILDSNLHDPSLKIISDIFSTKNKTAIDINAFYSFALLHLNLYARSADFADLIIDVDKLTVDKVYQKSVEDEIFNNTGISIDLSSAKSSFSLSLLDLGSESIVRETLNAMCIWNHEAIGPKGRALANQLVESLLEEYTAHRFYSGNLSRAVTASGGYLEIKDKLSQAENENAILRNGVLELEARGFATERALKDKDSSLLFSSNEINDLQSICANQSAQLLNLSTANANLDGLNEKLLNDLIGLRVEVLNSAVNLRMKAVELIEAQKKIEAYNNSDCRIIINIIRSAIRKLLFFVKFDKIVDPIENKLPTDFNSVLYLKINPDVLESGLTPEKHYLLYGAHENREFSLAKLPSDFDSLLYLKLNPDLQYLPIVPAYHYVSAGVNEHRKYK